MILLKLKLPNEAAWTALYRAHLATEVDGEWRPNPGVGNLVMLGVFRHATGATIEVDGMQVPEMVDAPSPGYHVDFTAESVPVELHPYLVNPTQPRHVFAGNLVLAMPEDLPEIEETALVTRGIGQTVPDDVLARIELAVLRGRLTGEQAQDKIALIEANIAIAQTRANLAAARQEREQAISAALAADAERDRLIALRDAETAKRQAAIDSLVGKVGAARTPFIRARDEAGAELTRLNPLITAEAAKVAAEVAKRNEVDATLAAEAAKITALRAERDTLKASIK